jgi:hypothetical protein
MVPRATEPNYPLKTFADHLNQFFKVRKRIGVPLLNKELAAEIGVHEITISRWRIGDREPHEWYWERIRKATGIELQAADE